MEKNEVAEGQRVSWGTHGNEKGTVVEVVYSSEIRKHAATGILYEHREVDEVWVMPDGTESKDDRKKVAPKSLTLTR